MLLSDDPLPGRATVCTADMLGRIVAAMVSSSSPYVVETFEHAYLHVRF